MVAVLEKSGTSLRVEVENTLLILPARRYSSMGMDEYIAISNIVARALVCEAIYDIVAKPLGYRSEVTAERLLTAGLGGDLWKPMEALVAQEKLLRQLGAKFEKNGEFELSFFGRYAIKGAIDVSLIEFGSARAKAKTKLDISSSLLDITKEVIAALLINALIVQPLNGGVNMRKDDGPIFVCTINHLANGDHDKIFDDAIDDLLATVRSQHLESPGKWRSRQLCLYRAGIDPGPIDGKYGKKTLEAEHKFELVYGVSPNWESRVFIRFLLEKANERHQNSPSP